MRIVQRSMNENNEQLMSDLDDLEREAKMYSAGIIILWIKSITYNK